MKYLSTIVCLFISLTLTAQQKTDPAELYPVFKSIKVKWDKKADYIYEAPLNECINGNCTDGEGVRLLTRKLELKYSSYTLSGMILKGKFTEGGNRFYGKVYNFSLPAGGDKKEKELRLGTGLDITDDAAMKPFYAGEGSYYMGPNRWGFIRPDEWGWDGEVKDVPALAKAFPDAAIHKAAFNKGNLCWIDASLPVKSRFIRYTGHTFASGDLMFGKAQLDNGDVYEGFFLKNSFHGPGKLTKRSGKITQGIWQIDSLTQEVAVVFPAALLQAVLPKPTLLKMGEANELKTPGLGNFYGEVINNEASGWGLWIMDGFPIEYAYGYWQHSLLNGAGIYLSSPKAGQLAFTGNKTTWQNEFWINTGVYKNGKIVGGNKLFTNYSVYTNQQITANDIQRLSFEKINLSTSPLQGCGMQAEFWYSNGYEATPHILTVKEGYYSNGKLSGFYFEDDKEKKRSYEFLKFPGYHPNWKFTEDLVRSAEASSNFCFDVIGRYKPLLVAEMKTVLEKNIAGEAWAKSPEGQAHNRRVQEENLRYAAERKKDCDAEFAKIGVKGRTYLYKGSSLVILEGYDCNKKEYIAWRPRQGNDIYSDPPVTQVRGLTGFLSDKLEPSVKQYHTCDECNGTGQILVTTTSTRTKELPWGYFSGIETKSIRTTTKEELKACSKCKGTAIILK